MKKRHPSLAAASAALIAATLVVAGLALPAHADESAGGVDPAGSAATESATTEAAVVAAATESTAAESAATESAATEPAATESAATEAAATEAAATEAAATEAAVVAAEPAPKPAETAAVSTAPGYVNDDGSGAGNDDDDSVADLPPQTGVTISIRVDGAEIGVGPIGERGPIERYELIVRPMDGGEPITRTSTTRTVFVLTGLKPGTYEIEASLHNSHGSTGTRNIWFAVPEVPGEPTVTIRDSSPTALLGEIWAAPLQNPFPEGVWPFYLPTTYTATLTGGGRTETREVDDVQGLGRFGFTDLDPSTTYTLTVVAQNVAGQSAPVSVQASTSPVTGPAAPDPDALTGDNRGGVVVDGASVPGTTVTANVGRDLAGMAIHGWLFSEPRYLGVATVTADGIATFALPSDIPAGAHRLALTTDDGTTLGWSPVEVRAADVTTPPATGGPDSGAGTGGSGTGGSETGGSSSEADGGDGAAPAASAVATRAEQRSLAATGGTAPWGIAMWAAALLAVGALAMTRRRVTD
ncbi:hypothetical protein ABC195_03630 [Microbacterium sp. 2P01SA-2]|uniref:hypothetical protein n=1 Tax=unclassified Microbacterium TaxID=2609290 RepID=UPI0039A118A5